jgi:hypothetical protein
MNSNLPAMDIERVRLFSRELFGSRYRLEVGVALAEMGGPMTYARELAQAVQLPDNVVRSELLAFAAAGLLAAHERIARNQPAYFERRPSAFWELARRLVAELASE